MMSNLVPFIFFTAALFGGMVHPLFLGIFLIINALYIAISGVSSSIFKGYYLGVATLVFWLCSITAGEKSDPRRKTFLDWRCMNIVKKLILWLFDRRRSLFVRTKTSVIADHRHRGVGAGGRGCCRGGPWSALGLRLKCGYQENQR